MSFHRGDILLVLFPDSNLRTAKRRPVVAVQADNLGAGLPQAVVAMITSNLARGGHPSRVVLRADAEARKRTGLLMDSVVMTDNRQAGARARLHRATRNPRQEEVRAVLLGAVPR
ncbi:MAG: type II toxin-antitoxin system PemK/MazF family toxin [Acidobacteriota bacterium]